MITIIPKRLRSILHPRFARPVWTGVNFLTPLKMSIASRFEVDTFSRLKNGIILLLTLIFNILYYDAAVYANVPVPWKVKLPVTTPSKLAVKL